MRKLFWFTALLLLAANALLESQETRTLADIARENRAKKQSSPTNTRSEHIKELIADLGSSDPEEYRQQMSDMLGRQDFEGLDRAARLARSNKSRFPGGPWKLYNLYQAISHPPSGLDWDSHIATLKSWISRSPGSITPRIALAQTYLNIGGNARGSGYADTVSEEGWKVYSGNASLALAVLNDAASLQEKCPYWYEAMVLVASAQGWSKVRTKAIVEQLITYEPSYYHVYREYANYLQPKWYGQEGDAEAFADDISERIGGDEGRFIYFEIATLLDCPACGSVGGRPKLPWPKTKEGYAALVRLYGTSDLKLNRLAFIATRFRDKPAAQEAFARIGDRWDPSVWTTQQRFEVSKAWANR